MDSTPELPSRTWIWALAVAVAFGFAFVGWHISSLYGGAGALAVIDHQLADEVTSLRQEVATQREAIEALKASAAKAVSTPATPGSTASEAVAPSQPKPKARR